ncbi:cobalt transporter [Paenibacillus larvae subsp. pulvifaciens]|uniref:Cobalt transporter n=1 Tax=Paenibacillus larvae subsp. pulvifaciens TaxID=1477 RepID=A0A1V0USN4_9BACL|nr:energy-coupling factor transporter transmembrane protein EcfT [Paenibacillus larvae]ARF68086.1 cobalt transporter [Paenibacillus larvae subsp. pulvifaciens]
MNDAFILGRYIETGSWIHRMDPRAKITAMVLYCIVILVTDDPASYGLVTVFSILMLLSSKIPLSTYVKAMKPLRFLMLFIFLFHLLFIKDGTALFSLGVAEVHSGGLILACTTVWRMGMLVSFTAILTFTTTPNKLAQGLEDVMKPLGWVGLSPEKLTLMISLALRFIPTIFEETEKILKAQASRGADIKELPWVEKGKMLVSLLVPVTVSSFRRAEDLVHSMESRGYVLGAPKTRYHRLNWSRNDSLFLASFLLLVFLVISGGIWL